MSADLYLANKDDYDAAIAATTNGGKPLIIDFTASWCPPCQMIGPVFERLAGEIPEVTFKKVDVDNNSEAAQAAQIQAMPTFKVYKDGAEEETMRGANQEGLTTMINKHK